MIQYRFRCHLKLVNAGSGAALNVSIFPTLCIDKKQFGNLLAPIQVHCVSDKELDSDKVSVMILDEENDILSGLLHKSKSKSVILKLEIYYKNIFGAGFFEKAEYAIYIPKDTEEIAEEWFEFLTKEIKKYEVDSKRYEALREKVPEDSKLIFNKIKTEVKEQFKEDLQLSHFILPRSFEVELIDLNSAIYNAQMNYKTLFKRFNDETNKEVAVSKEN